MSIFRRGAKTIAIFIAVSIFAIRIIHLNSMYEYDKIYPIFITLHIIKLLLLWYEQYNVFVIIACVWFCCVCSFGSFVGALTPVSFAIGFYLSLLSLSRSQSFSTCLPPRCILLFRLPRNSCCRFCLPFLELDRCTVPIMMMKPFSFSLYPNFFTSNRLHFWRN